MRHYLVWLRVLVLSIGILALLPNRGPAQAPGTNGAVSISGVVTDSVGQPVSGAIVSLAELHLQSVTGADGRFAFSGIPGGDYTLVARRLGYATLVRSHVSGGTGATDLRLTTSPFLVDPVTVTATRAPALVGSSVLPVSEMGESELRRNAGISLSHSLKEMPGVRSVGTGEQIGKPMIRGLFGSRVLVMQDGSRLEDYSWSEEDAPSVDARLAQRVEVIRGPASVLYGSDAIGGVVNVIPQDLPTTNEGRSFRSVGAEVYGASNNKEGGGTLTLEGASGRLGWRAIGIGRVAQSFDTPAGEVENTGYFSVNGEAAAGIRSNRSNTTLRFSHYGGEFKLLEARKPAGSADAGADAGPERKLSDDRLQLTNDFLFSKVRLETKAQFQRHSLIEVSDDLCTVEPDACSSTTQDPGAPTERPAFDLLLNTSTLDVLAHHTLSDAVHGTVGVAGLYQSNDSRGPIFLIPSATTTSGAAFVFEEATAGMWTLAGGARIDARRVAADANPSLGLASDRDLTWTQPSANLGVVFRPLRELSLTANGGLAWRAPTLFELYANGPHLAEARYEIGDASLVPETAKNLDLGARWQNDRVRAEVSVFRNYIDNFIYLTPTTEELQDLPVFRHVSADALMTGGEASLEVVATSSLLLRGGYDMVRGTNQDSGDPLPLMAPQRGRIGAEYHLDTSWASNAFISGEVEYTATQDRPNPLDFVTPGYTLINFDVGFQQHLLGRSTRIDLGVRNAANTAYRNFLSRYKEFALDPGRNLILRISTVR